MLQKIGKAVFFIVMVLIVLSMYLNRQVGDKSVMLDQFVAKSSLTVLSDIADRSVVTLRIGSETLSVEVVNTPASISQGLSGRTSTGADGMLFVMPERQVATFWMREMLFDLDIIWIDGDTIVNSTRDVPAPEQGLSLSNLPRYSSTVPVTHVLEVPAGIALGKNLAVGQKIELLK